MSCSTHVGEEMTWVVTYVQARHLEWIFHIPTSHSGVEIAVPSTAAFEKESLCV